MNAKLTRSTPPSHTCMIRTWPTARNSKTIPEIRMKSQAQSSKPRMGRFRPAPRGFSLGRGSSGRAPGVVAPPAVLQEELDDGRAHDPRDRDHGPHEQEHGGDAEGSYVASQPREEVDQHDLHA